MPHAQLKGKAAMIDNTENRKMVNIRLRPSTIDRLDKFVKSQRPPITKTALIEMLVVDYMDEREKPEPKAAKVGKK